MRTKNKSRYCSRLINNKATQIPGNVLDNEVHKIVYYIHACER